MNLAGQFKRVPGSRKSSSLRIWQLLSQPSELEEALGCRRVPAMASRPRCQYHDPGYYCLGVFEVEIRSQSVQGPAPGARGRDFEEGDPGLGDPVNHEGNINQEGDGDHEGGDGGQGPGEQPPEEPGQVAPAAEAPQPRNRRQRRIQRKKFTPVQLQELEGLFQRTQYPDVPTR